MNKKETVKTFFEGMCPFFTYEIDYLKGLETDPKKAMNTAIKSISKYFKTAYINTIKKIIK